MLSVTIDNRKLKLNKSALQPDLNSMTVLTESHWDYVSLWLKRNRKPKSLLYWQQAQSFAQAAEHMPVSSSPLLLYYSYMNASKALLSSKNITFEPHHGVCSGNTKNASRSKIALSNERVKIKQKGILPSLSEYMEDCEPEKTHTLEELLFNIPCIHRTFCLSYKKHKELFIPITDCRINFDEKSKQARFFANLSENYRTKANIRALPKTLSSDIDSLILGGIKSNEYATLSKKNITHKSDKDNISVLLKNLRKDIYYISGHQTLWYVKKARATVQKRLERSPIVCILAAMHRLSEICRYQPVELAAFLSGQKNWLITEFVHMSPRQFLDEISSEITGQQFMPPNVRPSN
ncbi:YaaC family protein [Zymobacter sp. IVIA_5232.4 C2]|uniref:YaaC family protein n=1 Tax=Zymobacter sp. IVIA_5232.4 C2 TaxID=3394855 RepID=UPI0039C1C014